MALTTAKAFDEFSAAITPTVAMDLMMKQRRADVERTLKEAFAGSNIPLLQTRLIGSAARSTITKPVTDIDVMAVFDDKQVWATYRGDSRKFLYRVRDKLNEKYRAQEVGARGQAVRLFYKQEPHVDIAVVFPHDHGGYVLPSGDGSWIRTGPEAHDKFLSDRNAALGGNLKRFTRMVKKWNDAHSKNLRSFHLEMIVQACFSSLGSNSRDAFDIFFRDAGNHLSVNDPAGYGGNLGSYLGFLTFLGISPVYTSLQNGRERVKRARAAEAKGDHKTAIGIWQWLLGPKFPNYG